MRFFDQFVSGTAAGSGVQSFFWADPAREQTGRVYYRLAQSGRYKYALLYSNTVDSTFADGSHSHANRMLDEWRVVSLRVGLCPPGALSGPAEPDSFIEATFDGRPGKWVMPGELFACDPFVLEAEQGEYLCVELTCAGRTLPCHPESLLPAFVRRDGEWVPSKDQPFLSMLGCARPVRARVGFLGDSITQGIGTPDNSYLHLSALLSEKLGPDAAVWNLGLGYGRAHDAALDGAWLFKARQNDVVCLCMGVNDLLHVGDAAQCKRDLAAIVRALKGAGVRVLLETLPPFDYEPNTRFLWDDVNRFLREELRAEADAFFDTVAVLGRGPDAPHLSKYGSHPDERGNAAWADGLEATLRKLLPH